MCEDGVFFGGCGHGELYLLAGKWRMEIIQNHIMDSLLDWFREHDGWFEPDEIRTIFDDTDSCSLLRHFVVRQTAHFLSTSSWADEEDEWRELLDIGGDFAFEVMKALRDSARRKIKSPGDQANCDFHIHVSGKRCDGTK